MKLDTMVMLREYDSIAQAEIAKSLLDNAGIWSMINNEYMSTIYPTGIMPAQVIVMDQDRLRALAVIQSLFESAEESVIVEVDEP